jgi:tripartite-type tricarboxylate transporter receptor subunit TctC
MTAQIVTRYARIVLVSMAALIGTQGAVFFFTAASGATDDYYRGKTIKLVVGASATGGYNLHARTLARLMPRHIPGEPTMIVVNMPAGSGIAATNHIYNIAEKDGTVFGLFNRYTILLPTLGIEQAKYKSEQFNWIGTTASYSDNAYLFVVRGSLPQRDVDSLRTARPPLNDGLVGAAPIQVINDALGLNLRMIHGYTTDNLDIAFENGEVDGHTIGYSTLLSRKRYWQEKDIARPIIQFGRATRHPDLPNVPTARELAKTPEQSAMIQFVEAPLLIGYPFALPPHVPAERVAIMRKAFEDTMADPEFRAEMEKQSLEFTPKDGAAVESLVKDLAKAPPPVIKRYKELIGHQSPG